MILKTLATLGLLTAALPANLALTGAALLSNLLGDENRAVAPDPKTILVSGGKMTKALQLARSFHRAGHRVILIEDGKYRLTGHRFSNAVDRFYTVPKPDSPRYEDALVEIIRKERVDVYVPVTSPLASRYDSLAKPRLSEFCEVIHVGPEVIGKLDDKDEFSETAAALGLSVPEAHRITDAEQVMDFDFGSNERRGKRYILKSIPYDPVNRMNLTKLPCSTRAETEEFVRSLPISEERPWVLQEFVGGREYCTHSTVRDGKIRLHCCCESSAFQLNYEMVEMPEIEAWVERFVGALGLTGQASFDFIRGDDGKLYAIECNPRTHSAITMFYDHPGVARAYLEDGDGKTEDRIVPTSASRPTYWLYYELWRFLTNPRKASQVAGRIVRGKDAIFEWEDPLPFLMVHHVHIPSLLLANLAKRREWTKIDFNIGKLVEPGGD